VSIGGNQIFKRPLLDIPTKGCINLHTALLPKYRGLMPSFWVLKNQEKYTGISVFMVDEGIDSGPLVVQKKIEIGNRTQEELITYTKDLGMDCILEAICLLRDGKEVLMPNPVEEMTYFSFPTRNDVKEFKRNGLLVIKDRGFSEYYVIPGGKALDTDDEELDVESGANKRDLLRAFRELQEHKANNRVLLGRFVKMIA
jgi:hypothetical protein